MKKILFLTSLFFIGLLFSCCPEKKNNQSESNEVIKSDSSQFKAIIREYKQLTDEDFEFEYDSSDWRFGPV